MIDYAGAGDVLAAFGQAMVSFDGDAWVKLFTDDAEYHENPFGAPLVGPVALRGYLLTLAETRREVEFTVERHWVSGATVLAAWRVAFTPPGGGDRVRISGFMTAEIAPDGRVARYRQWALRAPGGSR